MPPKKDAKDGKRDKKDDASEDKIKTELKALEGARQDLELSHAVLVDKLKQTRAENERLLQEVERFRVRITTANKDFADILEHREEQVRGAEARSSSLQQEVERLVAEIQRCNEKLSKLKELNSSQAIKLEDAAAMLTDKESLEAAVKKQHELIDKQSHELKLAKAQLEVKESSIEKAKLQIEELTLRCASSTQIRVLFNEPWLTQTSHMRLKGELPADRESNTLSCLIGGKQLIIHGGITKGREGATTETALLNLDTLVWSKVPSLQLKTPLLGHSSTLVGSRKLLVFGGSIGEEATSDAHVLAMDTLKWTLIAPASIHQPSPRLMHAAACVRDKVYIFGGMTADGRLMNDLWVLDLDTSHWTHTPCYGYPPCPRKGATMCPSEDGRRLYVFAGHDGTRLLNDVFYCEVERGLWSPVNTGGSAPEPREAHTAAILGKYMVIMGGCGMGPAETITAGAGRVAGAASEAGAGLGADAMAATAAGGGGGGGGARQLTDVYLLDLYTGPWWECLDDGAAGGGLLWLKQMSCYNAVYGNKLLTLKPNIHEQLDELQMIEITLPEDIERMRAAKKRDTEQVDNLEILDDAVCSSSSVEVGWQAPSKNAERITGFKLMIASSTGVVRDVYQGKALRHKVVGLKQNAEYVFCVKATYEDGSYLWSESKAFRTKVA